MTLEERVLLIAAARDRADIEYISSLPEKERDGLGGGLGFVRLRTAD